MPNLRPNSKVLAKSPASTSTETIVLGSLVLIQSEGFSKAGNPAIFLTSQEVAPGEDLDGFLPRCTYVDRKGQDRYSRVAAILARASAIVADGGAVAMEWREETNPETGEVFAGYKIVRA